jgi:hypothetical protein
MGVSFHKCKNCGDTVCDCGPFWICEKCGEVLCDGCRLELDASEKCPFCTLKVITDKQLLKFALKKLNATRKELEAELRARS